MGFQDCLHVLRVPYASAAAVEFADRSMEAVALFTRSGHRPSSPRSAAATRRFDGSLWDRGILPQDSLDALREQRGANSSKSTASETLDWTRSARAGQEPRHAQLATCMAIAPTATIANIIGVSQSIEPTYQNLYVKSNLSGEFTVVNEYLVHDLKARGLWDEVMVNDLKYFDGSVRRSTACRPS